MARYLSKKNRAMQDILLFVGKRFYIYLYIIKKKDGYDKASNIIQYSMENVEDILFPIILNSSKRKQNNFI